MDVSGVTITPFQLTIIINTVIMATSVAYVSDELAVGLGTMSWVGIISSGVLAAAGLFLILKLSLQFPDQNITVYSERLLGTIVGRMVNFYLLLYFFLSACIVIRLFMDMIKFYLFDRTPLEFLILLMVLVMVYCSMQPIRVVLKVAQATMLLSVFIMQAVFLALLINVKLDNLLPLFVPPMAKVFRETMQTFFCLVGFEIVLMIAPLVYPRKAIMKKALVSLLFSIMSFTWIVLMVIGIFGVPDVITLNYPIVSAIRTIEVPGTFVERLEDYTMLIWVLAAFDTAAIYYFMTCWCGSSILRLQDHRPIVLMLMPIAFIICQWPVTIEQAKFFAIIVSRMNLLLTFVIVPLLLFLSRRHKRRMEL